MTVNGTAKKCKEHPGKPGETNSLGVYCKVCTEQIKAAQASVNSHVSPKDCFITYKDASTGWVRIEGTGCAHWVAHQRNLKKNYGGCAEGYKFRVPEVIAGARKIDRKTEDVKINDIWANSKKDHCGLVLKVEGKGDKTKITIRHCSSGQGGVVDNDFQSHFKGDGDFYRL